MKIAVIALGKIGLPLAVQFASKGHEVVGVDVNQAVVDLVNAGIEPFPGEAHLQEKLLDLNEILIALSMSAATNPSAQAAFSCIDQLDGMNLHSTTILNANDEKTLRALGIDYTSDDDFATDKLFYGQ